MNTTQEHAKHSTWRTVVTVGDKKFNLQSLGAGKVRVHEGNNRKDFDNLLLALQHCGGGKSVDDLVEEGVITSTAVKIIGLMKSTKDANKEHFETLIGEREKGSKWGFDMSIEALASLPWQAFPEERKVPGLHLEFCDYYFLNTSDTEKHLPFSEQHMEPSNQTDALAIEVVRAKHTDAVDGQGVRFHELVSKRVKKRSCRTAWLIVGPTSKEDDTKIIWTAYPGELTPPLPNDWGGDSKKLDLTIGYAVKGFEQGE